MPNQEYRTFKNPLRAHVGGNTYEQQRSVFQKQSPGTIVQVFQQSTSTSSGYVVYRATTSKTAKGETVWEKIVNEPLTGAAVQAAGQYIWVQNGKPGKSDSKFSTIGRDGKTISYEDEFIKDVIVKKRIDNPKKYGNFIFVQLSAIETEGVTTATTIPGGAASSTSPAATTAITQNPGIDFEFLEKLQESNEKWDNFYKTGPKWREVEGFDPGSSSGPKWREVEGFDPGRNDGSSNPASSSPDSNRSSGGTRTSTPSKNQNQSGSGGRTVNVVVKNESFDSGIVYDNTMPYMEQKYSVYDRATNGGSSITRNDITRRHFFDIIPNSFEFSQLGSTWNEVPRSGNYPYVDWSNYNLTKVSFRFLVTGVRDSRFGAGFFLGQPLNDGLDVSIDEQLDNLRSMGASPSPIRIYNMNTLLTNSFRYPFTQKAGGISWVIADMSITANRLTPGGKNIAAAEVAITLNEYPIIARDIVYVPKLVPGKDTPRCCPPPVIDPKRDLFTNTYESLFLAQVNQLSYAAPKEN